MGSAEIYRNSKEKNIKTRTRYAKKAHISDLKGYMPLINVSGYLKRIIKTNVILVIGK